MITVTIWHNVASDEHGRETATITGYQPGDPVTAVFAYQSDPTGGPEAVADEAYAIFNGHPFDGRDNDLVRAYYGRGLRAPCVGDVIDVGGTRLAVGKGGSWPPVRDPLNEVRADTDGTHPLPLPGAPPGATTASATRERERDGE